MLKLERDLRVRNYCLAELTATLLLYGNQKEFFLGGCFAQFCWNGMKGGMILGGMRMVSDS